MAFLAELVVGWTGHPSITVYKYLELWSGYL
jgi:hypothetical protein